MRYIRKHKIGTTFGETNRGQTIKLFETFEDYLRTVIQVIIYGNCLKKNSLE